MRPRADEIMSSVVDTYDQYVLPEIDDPYAKSLGLTISNLLRLVQLRIEQEGPIIHADNLDLRETLAAIAAYCSGPASGGRFGDSLREIEEVLERPSRPVDEYPTLARMDEEAAALRWPLQRAIRALEAARDELGDTDDYQAVRATIRGYLRRSLEREGSLILPAFTGERR